MRAILLAALCLLLSGCGPLCPCLTFGEWRESMIQAEREEDAQYQKCRKDDSECFRNAEYEKIEKHMKESQE